MYGRQFPQRGYNPRPIAPPPSQQSGFGQGVKQFIDTYRAEQQGKKAEARQLFEQHAKMMEAGIPVDKKKMAKWARQADLHFDLDAPPPPPAQAPMLNNNQVALPGAPEGAPMGVASPSLGQQAGAQYGLQQSLGGPAAAPAPPPPPAPKPGFMSRLGASMGVPQPPSQQQQMGVMRMLKDMESRGQQNKQMQAMQQQMAQRGIQIAMELDKLIGAGATYEDPRVLRLFAQLQTLQGLPGMGDRTGKLVGNAIAELMTPNVVQKEAEQASEKENSQKREKYRSSIASKLKPEDAISAEAWVFGESEEAPKFARVDSDKLNQSVLKLTAEYPNASPDQIRDVALKVFSDSDPAELAKAVKGLGESVSQTRMKMTKERLGMSRESNARAREAAQRGQETDAMEAEVKAAVGQMLQYAGNPEVAFDNANLLSIMAFGGDVKKATDMLPDVQKMLKSLMKTKRESIF